jgi:hypothetical protein
MSPEEILTFNNLLRKISEEEKGWIPKESMKLFYGLVVSPYFEILMYRKVEGEYQYFLAHRSDGDWQGFHVPGSMIKPWHPEKLEDMCRIIAQGELPKETAIKNIRLLTGVKWKKHPWSNPLAFVCLCEADGEVQETEKGKFFPLSKLPEMIDDSGYHLWYLEIAEAFLTSEENEKR